MSLSLAAVMALVQSCAPTVAPGALIPLVWTESAFDPLTIGVNGRLHRSLHPTNRDEAVQQARALLARGLNLDLGLTQVNTRNLGRLGLTLDDAFDPCRNLAAGARVLTEGYVLARARSQAGQAALGEALSRYNTGDAVRGFKNGYVAHVYRAAATIVPALTVAAPPNSERDDHTAVRLEPETAAPLTDAPAAAAPSVDVFATRSASLIVWGVEPSAPSSTREQPPQSRPPGAPS